MRVLSHVDASVKMILPAIGVSAYMDCRPAAELLGIDWRAPQESFIDMAYSVIAGTCCWSMYI